jgi:hypothetical protein
LYTNTEIVHGNTTTYPSAVGPPAREPRPKQQSHPAIIKSNARGEKKEKKETREAG